jgi:hypothetical protein
VVPEQGCKPADQELGSCRGGSNHYADNQLQLGLMRGLQLMHRKNGGMKCTSPHNVSIQYDYTAASFDGHDEVQPDHSIN